MKRGPLVIASLLAASLALAVGPPPGESIEVTRLISQLGDDDPAARRAAMTRLEAIGEPAAAPLRRLGGDSRADLDVRLRAHAVAGAIEAKLYGELRTFTGHTDGVIAVAASPDGKTLASGSWGSNTDHTVRLWDVATGKNVRTLGAHLGGTGALAFLPGGKQLLTGGNNRVLRLWDVATGKEVRTFTGIAGGVHSLAVSGDGKTAVSCCAGNAALQVWDLEKGTLRRTLAGHTQVARGVAFVGNDRCLSAGFDGTVRVWDIKEGKLLVSLSHVAAAWFVAARPDGKRAASVGADGRLRIWDLETFKLIRSVQAHSPQGSHGVAYSPDGRRLLTCGYAADRGVTLWDAETGRLLQTLGGHTDQALGVAFLPGGRRAVSGGYDKTLRLWGLRR